MFKINDVVFIPEYCPITEEKWGPISGNKAKLLGTMQKIRRVDSNDKLVLGDGWYFSAKDLCMGELHSQIPEKKEEILLFNPENLVV